MLPIINFIFEEYKCGCSGEWGHGWGEIKYILISVPEFGHALSKIQGKLSRECPFNLAREQNE